MSKKELTQEQQEMLLQQLVADSVFKNIKDVATHYDMSIVQVLEILGSASLEDVYRLIKSIMSEEQ